MKFQCLCADPDPVIMLTNVFSRVQGEIARCRDANRLVTALGETSIRWRTKPRWLPVAKSKMFRIPERKPQPKEEREELKKLHNIYRTEFKSIRLFFHNKIQEMTTGESVIMEQKKREEDEHLKCIRINDEWNQSVAKLREKLLAEDKEKELEETLKQIEENRLQLEKQKEEAERLVREEKERSKYYITNENIDEVIEHAMANPVDYNFCIDLDCNVYHGRLARKELPPKNEIVEPKNKEAATG